ncbi:MAG: PEP-CTERM sorting domain-containing protein [Verrucomicrobiae bacterium]|nr:PEP-CTERM sorting domain-containing protein [Verrucomicrobiae bacterium]
MKKTLTLAFIGLAVAQADATTIFTAGLIDNLQAYTPSNPGPGGGGANAIFVQEAGPANDLPGSPLDTGGEGDGRVIDDDYYFAGNYTTVVDGGSYTPVGLVVANEGNMERAWTGTDQNLRYHFNFPASTGAADPLQISFGVTNGFDAGADGDNTNDIWTIDAKMNGNSIFTQDVSIGDINGDWTSPSFTLADIGNPGVGEGFDNYVELTGTVKAGDSRWLSLDYVQLDNNAAAVPEPSTGLLVFFGGLALLPVFRRRR